MLSSFPIGRLAIIPLILCGILSFNIILATLPTLPRSRDVDSTMLMINDKLDEASGLFNVREFIDQARGSVKVDVADVTEVDLSKAKRLSYYRLEQNKKTYGLVKYDSSMGGCSEENTSTWILNDFSQAVENLFAIDESLLKTEHIEADASLVGPNVLLQLVYDNADKFTLDSKGFDDIHLTNSYYFATQVFDFGLNDEVKLIAIVQGNHINVDAHNPLNDMDEPAAFAKIKIGTTKLDELSVLAHITAVGLVTDTKRHSASGYLAKKSALLTDFATLRPPQLALMVAFTLVQERSQHKHLGTTDENPHLLPAGVGCGEPASRHQPLYVLARQFSGLFSADDHPDDYFVAYDETSNHFRYDSLGKHKIIYALNDHLATFIKVERGDGGGTSGPQDVTPATTAATTNASASAGYQNRVHENSYHCAQTSLNEEPSLQNQMVGVNEIGDVLGLGGGGSRIGLMYLGYDHTLNCYLYEREILHSQIPLLTRLHLRLKPSPSKKFTLVYYFVNELDSLTHGGSLLGRQVHAFESMWLKRMELVMWSSLVRNPLLNSRLTFSRSSWSLASVSEESHRRQSELLHPARMFDTLECWPARCQTQLDFVLKRKRKSDKGHSAASPEDAGGHEGSTSSASDVVSVATRVALVESLEETLMKFLLQQIGFPRSEVCDFELIVPEEDESEVPRGKNKEELEDELRFPNTMLVRSKLVKPLEYNYEKYLLGWLKSIMPVLKMAHQAKVLEHKYLMNIHECLMELATTLGGQLYHFHMLYCPNVGCGLLLDEKYLQNNNSDYVLAKEGGGKAGPEAPSTETYPEMCEVYLVKRRFSTEGLVSERFRPEVVRSKLEGSKMTLEVYDLTDWNEISTGMHQATVSRVALTSGLNLNLIDDQLVKGICYTLNTKLLSKLGKHEHLEMRLIELNFDKHHSRAHCHKACLMYEFCQTYSYSKKRRVCHLSSASRANILDPFMMLNEEGDNKEAPSDCTLHAVNHVSLYKRRPIVIYDTLERLLADKSKKLLIASLDECANLCRLNELKRTPGGGPNGQLALSRSKGCQHFAYIRMLSVCVLEDEVELPNEKLAKGEEIRALESIVQNNREPSEVYQRNFLQDYAVSYSLTVELNWPNGDQDQGLAKDRRADDDEALNRAVIMMRGLDEFECSRECSILDRGCVAFESCSRSSSGSYEQICRLYRIRSPLTVPRLFAPADDVERLNKVNKANKLPESSPFVAQLTQLEADFYVAGRSSEHQWSSERKLSCNHYYLEGDRLYLKRLLNVARRNYQHEDELIESLANEMKAKSERATATTTSGADKGPGGIENKSQAEVAGGKSVVSMVFEMLVGSALGFALFILQPTLVQLVTNSKLLETLQSGRLFQWPPIKRRERSMSRVEITEMMDLDEDEGQNYNHNNNNNLNNNH